MIPTLLLTQGSSRPDFQALPHSGELRKRGRRNPPETASFSPRSETATQEEDQPCPLLPPKWHFGSCSSTTTPSFASCSPSCSAQTSERRSSALPPTARRVSSSPTTFGPMSSSRIC